MKRIPKAQEVDRALKATTKSVRTALKELNREAAKLMARGDYDAAERMAETGKRILEFESEVASLLGRWRELKGSGTGASSKTSEQTLQWHYYQPVLQALVELGGEGTRAELEPLVEQRMRTVFKNGDSYPMARGKQRWQVMIQRARRHLVKEGWLEPDTGMTWRLTASGGQAAKRKMVEVPAR